MSNYKGSFRPGEENDNWNIAFELIKPKSRVLDVGCSNGNFGEALINYKHCEVEGVEPDEGDARLAAKKLTKVYNTNIEDLVGSLSASKKYDHIVFLDVIEHLYRPSQTIRQLKPYLKKGGTIVFSIPNMGHQSVRVMLLKGDFEYGQTGILDNTHLHFYTEKEINRVFRESDMELETLRGVSVMYDDNMLKDELKKVGVQNAGRSLIRTLGDNNAHIYQFVGAASASNKPEYGALEREFQSPSAKAVFKKHFDKQLQNHALAMSKYEQTIINLDRKYKKLDVETKRLRNMYMNLKRSSYWGLIKLGLKALKSPARIKRSTRTFVSAIAQRTIYSVSAQGAELVITGYSGNGEYNRSRKELKRLNGTIVEWSELVDRHKNNNAKLVSIIVLVYNNYELTKRCIDSIFETKNKTKFEVIVVNNGSNKRVTNKLRRLKQVIPSIKLVEIDKNTNFALGNNIGFKFASGGFSVFLNNDTYVTDHWLDGLLKAFSLDYVKVAQPTLLYPDGAVQNIGIAFSDKSSLGYPIYANSSSKNVRVMKSRRLQAVTGACMMIRSEVFAKNKGFDPSYINGQEDVDLCLRLNNSGEEPGYCAMDSVVYHDESKTPGRGRYVLDNRKTFVKKWAAKIVSDDVNFYNEDGYSVAGWVTDSDNSIEEDIVTYTPVLKLASKNELDITALYAFRSDKEA